MRINNDIFINLYTIDDEDRDIIDENKPKEGELYFYPKFINVQFYVGKKIWLNDSIDNLRYDKGWVMNKKSFCKDLCFELNNSINKVK